MKKDPPERAQRDVTPPPLSILNQPKLTKDDRLELCKDLILKLGKEEGREPSLKEIMALCECSKPTSIRIKQQAHAHFKITKADLGPRKLTREERIERCRTLILEAAKMGRAATLKEIMTYCECKRDTAIDLRKAVTAALASEGAVTAIVKRGRPIPVEVMPSPGIAIARSATPAANGLTTGIDMLGTLQESARKLHQIAQDLQSDLKHARFFLLGAPEKGFMPGYCVKCGNDEAQQLTVQSKPVGLQVGYGDLATLARSAVQTEAAIAKIVETYNDVLAQLYNYGAMQNYISDVRTAIVKVVPERARDIANELKRLQARTGGAHGEPPPSAAAGYERHNQGHTGESDGQPAEGER